MDKPGLIITGASGFLGSRLLKKLNQDYKIFAIALHAPKAGGKLERGRVHWFPVHIGHLNRLQEVFYFIKENGGAQLLLHLAAYYDFTGDDDPEYQQTNIIGTRNLLKLSELLKLKKFIFTSSVAACPFPDPMQTVTEDTAPTAPHPYGKSKLAGEKLLKEFQNNVPSCILRPAAIFSDWCEYEPLDHFLRTWCSNNWNARIHGGKGHSALPYLHEQDLITFYLQILKNIDALKPREVLLASPDGSVSLRDLYYEVTTCFLGTPGHPVYVPKFLARLGIVLRQHLGRMTGKMPFERSWMADYIDLSLNIDASRTRRRIDWSPREDLTVLKRVSYMVRNLQNHPDEWKLRNKSKKAQVR